MWCNGCLLKLLNYLWVCVLLITVPIWLYFSSFSWNCTENWEKTFHTTPPDSNECNNVENWIGSLQAFSYINHQGIFCRFAIVITLFVATCRMRHQSGPLFKYGMVKSKNILELHIVIATIDLGLNYFLSHSFYDISGKEAQAYEKYQDGYKSSIY